MHVQNLALKRNSQTKLRILYPVYAYDGSIVLTISR